MVELVDLGMLILAVAIGTAMARILTAALCSFLINLPTILLARRVTQKQDQIRAILEQVNQNIEQERRQCALPRPTNPNN